MRGGLCGRGRSVIGTGPLGLVGRGSEDLARRGGGDDGLDDPRIPGGGGAGGARHGAEGDGGGGGPGAGPHGRAGDLVRGRAGGGGGCFGRAVYLDWGGCDVSGVNWWID